MICTGNEAMKEILEKWSGKFEINGEIHTDLQNIDLKDGDEFHITLLSKNRKVEDEEDILRDVHV